MENVNRHIFCKTNGKVGTVYIKYTVAQHSVEDCGKYDDFIWGIGLILSDFVIFLV